MAEIGARHHPFKVGYESCTGVRVPPGPLQVLIVSCSKTILEFLSIFSRGFSSHRVKEKNRHNAGLAHRW